MNDPILEISIQSKLSDDDQGISIEEAILLENHITEIVTEMMKHIDLDKE